VVRFQPYFVTLYKSFNKTMLQTTINEENCMSYTKTQINKVFAKN